MGWVQRRSQSRPCAPALSPLSNGVVNEEGQLRCLGSSGPNLGDNAGLLPPSRRPAGRPVPTLANGLSATPRAVEAAAATEILHAGLSSRSKQLTPHLLPAGPTRTVRSFGLVLCLGSSHLSMSAGTRPAQAVSIESFPRPLPKRWTHSGFTHSARSTHRLAGSLPGEYRAPSGQPVLLPKDSGHVHPAT